MARLGVSAKRRQQLIEATIRTISTEGFAGASLMTIGRRAGLSPGIVAHYFRDKAGLLEATMRHINRLLRQEMCQGLRAAETPAQRLGAIVDASFAPEQFSPEMTRVWVTFWAQANHVPQLHRIQRVYRRRLESNIAYAAKQLTDAEHAWAITLGLGALIDGLALRHGLREGELARSTARAIAQDYICRELNLRLEDLERDADAA